MPKTLDAPLRCQTGFSRVTSLRSLTMKTFKSYYATVTARSTIFRRSFAKDPLCEVSPTRASPYTMTHPGLQILFHPAVTSNYSSIIEVADYKGVLKLLTCTLYTVIRSVGSSVLQTTPARHDVLITIFDHPWPRESNEKKETETRTRLYEQGQKSSLWPLVLIREDE